MGTVRCSWRHLGVLIRWLPPGSALHREMDPEGWGWDADTYLLANLIDIEQSALWQRGGGKGQRPKPFWRPPDPTVRRVSWDEKVRMYEAHKLERQRELEQMASQS